MQLNQLIAAVRGVVRDREIARLMPAASHKAEPVVQRRNPARDVKRRNRTWPFPKGA